MKTVHEWDVERVCDDEVLEHYHQESYADCLNFVKSFNVPVGEELHVVLVRDDDKCRSWAYVEDGALAEIFTDACDRTVAKVPNKYHVECGKKHNL